MKKPYVPPKVTKHRSLSSLPAEVRREIQVELTFVSQAGAKPCEEGSAECFGQLISAAKSLSERVVVDNRPLAIRILDIIERYHAENTCLRLVLRENFVSRWPQKLQKLMNDPQIAAEITDEIRPIRSEVMRSRDPAEQLDALSRCFQDLGRRKD